MSKRIVLHIGSGKAGSTSIQSALQNSFVGGKFPSLLNYKNNQIFRFAFCKLNGTTRDLRLKYANKDFEFKKYQKAIKDSFKEEVKDVENIVISSEFLFQSTTNEIFEIKKFLTQIGFTEFHILAYVRTPHSYYLSSAQQAFKTGPRLPCPLSFNYSISTALNNWEKFGANSFVVKEFAREKLIDEDVVSDFENYLISLNPSFKIGKPLNENATMSTEATQVLQDIQEVVAKLPLTNEKTIDTLRILRRFSASKQSKGGTKPILKKQVADVIKKRFHNEIAQVRNSYGIFEDFAPVEEETETVELNKFLDIVEHFSLEHYLELKGIQSSV